MLARMGLQTSKFYDWSHRYGQPNEHNGIIPKAHWLRPEEVAAILKFWTEHPFEGYRRLTYMMMDQGIVAVSPSTTYNVLDRAGYMSQRPRKPSHKGQGFVQPLKPHQHWHTDITYINISGTFYYMCGVLDGYSRTILNWDIRESMKTEDLELILQKTLEKYPDKRPRVISDNGPQFISREFKEFIRFSGMDHVRTSPYYPQSNGKYERMNGSLKKEVIRAKSLSSIEEARRCVENWVGYYNEKRLHSGIGYIAPLDKLQERAGAIHARREQMLIQAQEERKKARKAASEHGGWNKNRPNDLEVWVGPPGRLLQGDDISLIFSPVPCPKGVQGAGPRRSRWSALFFANRSPLFIGPFGRRPTKSDGTANTPT